MRGKIIRIYVFWRENSNYSINLKRKGFFVRENIRDGENSPGIDGLSVFRPLKSMIEM